MANTRTQGVAAARESDRLDDRWLLRAMRAMTLGADLRDHVRQGNGYADLHGKREPVPVDRSGDEADRSGNHRGVFRAATAGLAENVKEIGSDLAYEKADREVTARFAGYGLGVAAAAPGAISLGADGPSIGVL